MSYKNKLQELCQKHNMQLPRYGTFAVYDGVVLQGFRSRVLVNNTYFEGSIESRKRNAEKSAAETACTNILGDLLIYSSSLEINKEELTDVIVIVDVENIGTSDGFKILNQLQNIVNVTAVHSLNYDGCCDEFINNIICVESCKSDVADLYICGLICRTNYKKIFLLTQDHFGDTMIDIYHLLNDNINEFNVFAKTSDLISFLKN